MHHQVETALGDIDRERLALLAEPDEADFDHGSIILFMCILRRRAAPLEPRGIEKRQQVLVPRRGQRGKLERIEKDAVPALRVTDHEPRAIAAVVASDFDRGEFANQTKCPTVRNVVGSHG